MSEPSNHSGMSPRAFILLAHHVEAGRCVADAARMTGVDPEIAEEIAQGWLFQLLMWLVPFFRINVGQSAAKTGERKAPARARAPARRWAFSVHIRCDASKEAAESATGELALRDDGAIAEAAVTSGKTFAANLPPSRKQTAGRTGSNPFAALCGLSSEALFAPLVEKIA